MKPSTGIWAAEEATHWPQEAVQELRRGSPDKPGDWTPIVRRFRDGHTETWWAVDLADSPYGPDQRRRMVEATTDPRTLPDLSSRYLTTNLPHPGRGDRADVPFAPADLVEVVRLCGLRNRVERGHRQVRHEMGWADFVMRADRAIRRHRQLVCCAFACWRQWFASAATLPPPTAAVPLEEPMPPDAPPAGPTTGRGQNRRPALLAPGAPAGPRLAGFLELPRPLLTRVVRSASRRSCMRSSPGSPTDARSTSISVSNKLPVIW